MEQNKPPKRILVTRFSSLGDVAMTLPVIKSFLKENPTYEIFFVSRLAFSSLFENIDRLIFKPIDLNHKHKSIFGIFKFYKEIKKENIVAYADLHNVIRTKILQILFRLICVPTAGLNKGRKDKKLLIRKKDKHKVPLTNTVERYAEVFRKLGFNLTKLEETPYYPIRKESKIIGIAPFAQFKSKTYPLEKLKQVANHWVEKGYQIALFGGGKQEIKILNSWAKESKNTMVINESSLAAEIEVIKKTAFLITMDSANMHLASLANTAVFSVWGGTHIYSGFLGYKQSSTFSIEDKNLECRPCSVFGTNNCYRKDFACINNISSEQITNKIESFL